MTPRSLTFLGRPAARRVAMPAATAAALAVLLLADYHPMALTGVLTMIFAAYVAGRLILWLGENRMTPRRWQVGANWALVGYNSLNGEFEIGPVRVYFLLLALQFAGLFLRPLAQWILP
jgi:hypothetical protein